LGPEPVSDDDFVTELCPYQAVIDLDAAYLKLSRKGEGSRMISLRNRCAPCAKEIRIAYLLEENGLLGDETGQNSQCQYRSCFKLGWCKAKYCEEHLIFGLEKKDPHVPAAKRREALEGNSGLTAQRLKRS
jgi:hypothetical protein